MPVEFLKPSGISRRREGVEFLKPEPLAEDVGIEEPAPSIVEEPTFTEERLKTMELEGIPLRGPAEMEKRFALEAIGQEPLAGLPAYPVDITETLLHFGKGVAALPAVGSKMWYDALIPILAGVPFEEALEIAQEKSAWITPRPVGGGFGEFVAGAFEKLHEGFLAVGEQVPEPQPMFDMSPEATSLVHDMAKTVVGTAAEGGFYLMMGLLGRGLYRRAKGRKVTVEDVKETLAEVKEAPPEGIEGAAGVLAEVLERSLAKPLEPAARLRKRRVPPIEPEEAIGEVMPMEVTGAVRRARKREKKVEPLIVEEVAPPKVEEPTAKIDGIVRKSEEGIPVEPEVVEVVPPRAEVIPIRPEPPFKPGDMVMAKPGLYVRGKEILGITDETFAFMDSVGQSVTKAQFDKTWPKVKEKVRSELGGSAVREMNKYDLEIRAQGRDSYLARMEALQALFDFREGGRLYEAPREGLKVVPKRKPAEPEAIKPVPPTIEEPAVKISDRIQKLYDKGKNVEEIAKAIDMTEEATAMAMFDMRLFKRKRFVTREEVEGEAADIVSRAQNLDQVQRGIRELAVRFEENLDVGFKTVMDEMWYRDWGDTFLDKITVARRKAGLVEELKPDAPLDAVTKEGERVRFVDPTDKGGFETRKAAEDYRIAFEELGEVIENPNRPGQFVFRSERPPTSPEAVSFGGMYEFQKMYERFVNRTKRRAEKEGKIIRSEAREVLDRGKVIKQRVVKGLERPPIYESVYGVLKNAKVLKETMFRGLEHPIRTFREAAGEALLDLTTHEYDFRDNAGIRWSRAARRRRGKIIGDLSSKEYRRVFAHGISREVKGPELLAYSRIKTPKWEDLTPKEQTAYISLRERLKAWYIRANRMRKSIGKESFPETKDYFTFARSFTLMERAGFRPFDMKKSMLNAQFIKMREAPSKYTKPRTKALYKLDLNLPRVLERYEGEMIRHITMSPLIAKVREYLGPIKDPKTGKTFTLANVNPELAKSLSAWANYVAGMRPPNWRMHPTIENVLYRVNSNLVASILGFMWRSAFIQPSALQLTVSEIGFTYTMRGVLSLMSDVPGLARDVGGIMAGKGPPLKSRTTRKSKVLLSRTEAIIETGGLRATRETVGPRAPGWVTRQSLKPLQILDFEAAKATRIGARMHGEEVLKLKGKRLETYADDVVTRTQASARPGHVPPIRRTAIGRALTLFQTFTLNEWDFMVKDVVGLRRIRAADEAKAFSRSMRWIAAAMLINMLYEDVLGMHSPRPTPIRAFMDELDKGGSIPSALRETGLEVLDPVPFVGGTRYGRGLFGPVGELAGEIQKYVRGDAFAPPGWELAGYWFGIPGTAQLAKTLKARERGETPYGQLVGTYTPPGERAAAPGRARRVSRRRGRSRRR